MALSVDTTPAKHVTVLRNGDGKYEGRKFVVSRRRYRTFDALLSDITHQISAPFGAVRRLYTPKGSRQIRGIDDLEGGATYVAGGSERFKKINYNPQQPGKNWGFTSNVKPGFLADDPPPLILPKKNKKYAQRSAQFHKVRQPVQFTVYRNGLGSDKGTKFLLKAREMKSFETVLSIISFKIRLVEGAVRRLFTLEGALLHGPEDIVDGGQYVACGHRRFILASYGESNQPARTQKLPSIKRRKDPNQASPRTQSNPLPAIQKKTAETKARSEKDSPAPIEEDKGNDEVMVIVSRGSQADLVEDDPDQIASENGHLSPDEPACNANASDALAINSPEGMTTPPPNGHVNYDNDLHDTNSDLYKTTEGAGENPGELNDGQIPDKGRSGNGDAASPRLSPDNLHSPDNGAGESEENSSPTEVVGVIGEADPSVDRGNEVVPKSHSPDISESRHEAVHEDEAVSNGKEDTAEIITSPHQKTGPTTHSPVAKGENLEEDISRTEVTTVSPKSRSRIPIAKKSNQAVSSEEIKSLPSKSKLDRNPPKKKSNPELLANGSDDSVFNATAAKTNNQDGQFLMNNVEEGETNGHEDGDEIEEDGELVEDKPIDLQQAEEIPEDDTNVPKRPNRESRSQSSNK
ncbi:hypothetical protein ACHWQZ_G017365 [Mnemiopsis leidyi]